MAHKTEQTNLAKMLSVLEKLEGADLSEILSRQDDESEVYDSAYIENLQQCYRAMEEKHSFHKGQLVKWKPHLNNKKLPKLGQPAIVLDILDSPIVDEEEPSSTYFREHLDIVLGVFDPNGTFLKFYYDSSRFEPYEQELNTR
jgi:hypothetical protein